MVCFLPLAHSSLRDFCWSLLKLCYQHHGLKGHFLPAVRIAVLFHTWGRHDIPLTTDEEQRESTNTIRSIPLTFTFITGSTSSSLCGERVVPASRPLPSFPDTSMRHVLVVGTDNCVSPGALFVICPWAVDSLWQSDWDLHICSTAL